MRFAKLRETLGIYGRWGWLSLYDPIQKAAMAKRMSFRGPFTFRMHCPGLGMFAHLNWCLLLAGWAEQQGKLCQFQCTSPNYGNRAGSLDWLPQVLEQKSCPAFSQSRHITVRRWEYLPHSAATGMPASLADARLLLRRHFSVPEALMQKAQAFMDAQFGRDFVIGLHYRGTDKRIEAAMAGFDEACASVDRAYQAAQAAGVSAIAIFVATDEERFAEHIKRKLTQARIVMLDGALRSADGTAIHAAASDDGTRRAKEAMIDALLLGGSHLLIKTASTLSGWAPILGKPMPIVMLSKPFERCNWFPDALLARSAAEVGNEAEAVRAAAASS